MKNKLALSFELIRPHQWIKNIFCFAGVAFGKYYSSAYIFKASLVFLTFCFASSCVYILNDIIDAEADRHHATKKNRPLAAKKLTFAFAYYLASLFLILTITVSIFAGLPVLAFAISYILLNIAYSLKLKNIVILDVFIISIGFLFRLLAGTIGLGIFASDWLVLCTLMITLLLGFSKRRAELLMNKTSLHQETFPSPTRRVLDSYTGIMLDIFIAITASCSILSYSLFVILTNQSELIYTIFFVLYGIFRYLFRLYQYGDGQDTANELLNDPHSMLAGVLWLAIYLHTLLR